MATTTSVENIIINNPSLAGHPRLAEMIALYSEQLAAGYDPDPALLTEMFGVLVELIIEDPDLALSIFELDVTIVEEVLVRDQDLSSNAELGNLLSFYLEAIEGGYTPSEETQNAVLEALSAVDTTDPAIADLVASVIAAVSPLESTFGFVLNGIDAGDQSGWSVASAGDVNGDGIDDILIGARNADPNGTSNAGETYVIFGSDAGFDASLDLAALDGTNGFVLNGIDSGGESGFSVASAGDVNGDGIDDILIGARLAGETYVVFGSAAGFTASLDLATLDGTNGFVLNGIGLAGTSVASAGDVNGDGIDDILIGAPHANLTGARLAGKTYVVFGSDAGFDASLDLAALDGTNGFVLNGIDVADSSGISVASAGDVNSDGIDDILIGALFADPNGPNSGETYVVFGSDAGFDASLDLSTLDGSNGFVLNGIGTGDQSGIFVASAGDVNGDAIDDILVGAYLGDPNGANAGEIYVVFGSDAGFTASLDLAALDGTNGFVLNGVDAFDFSGFTVASAGDVNGDGIDDILIGAGFVDPNKDFLAGDTYLVFGSDAGFAASLDLAALDGTNGFVFKGINADDQSSSVASAGDVNGDGIDDILIGARHAGATDAGETYLIYGGADSLEFFDAADGSIDGSIDLANIGLNPADFDVLV